MACHNHDRVLSYEFVPLNRTVLLPNTPGLYYLVSCKKILYVGLSKSLYNRWNRDGLFIHRKKAIALEVAKKCPIRIYYRTLPAAFLATEEAEEIHRFKPPLNKIQPARIPKKKK